MSSSDASGFRDRLPPFFDAPPERRGRGDVYVRYEDVSQDGRLGARPSTHAIGAAIWRGVLDAHPMASALMAQGILPILSRLVVCGGGGPISVRARTWGEGAFQLVEVIDEAGRSRFRMDMCAELSSIRSRTFEPMPAPEDEQTITLGAVWAEHVLTRPFAPPSERAVDQLPEGLDLAGRAAFAPPWRSVSLPEGAQWVDADWVVDPTPLALGLGHTDSNQHVNSLVYPQLLEDAALRRLAALRRPFDRYVSRFEMAYRKPSFAGDCLRLRVRLYERGLADGRTVTGLAGVFATDAEHASTLEKARVFGTVELEP